ncbi:MAG: type II CAAX endopeptidase family protein [Flavobacteriales bacterium]
MQRDLLRFFALAYGISWLIWAPLWLPAFGVAVLPVFPLQHALGGLGPLFAAFVMMWRETGGSGIRKLAVAMISPGKGLYWAIALFGPFVLLLVAMAFSKDPLSLSGMLRTREFPTWSFVVFALYNLVFFGFGEETGWRGYALPRLQHGMNALWASVVLTLFWALWHWPLFLYRPGYVSMDLAGIAGWLFSLLTGSVLLTWLFNGSRGSVLVVALLHSTIDIAFTCDSATPDVVPIVGALITLWGIATVLFLKPRDLARSPRVTDTYSGSPPRGGIK